jgi:RHS repeat-associated protein
LPLLLDDGADSYLYGPSSAPIAQVNDSTGAIQYLHGDLVGSTRLITSSSGTAVGTTEYDAYGNRTAHTGTADSTIGYSGNWTDPDTGLIYLRARDYDPATAQFLTVDPDIDTTRQPYGYTADDPLSSVDPNGLNCKSFRITDETTSPSFFDSTQYKMDIAGFRDGDEFGISLLSNDDYAKYGGNASFWVEYADGVAVTVASFGIAAVGDATAASDEPTQHQMGTEPYEPGTKGAPASPKEFIPPTNPPQDPPADVPDGFSIRVMKPTADYPQGYWRLYKGTQAVDPSTMEPPGNVSKAQFRAETHVSLP